MRCPTEWPAWGPAVSCMHAVCCAGLAPAEQIVVLDKLDYCASVNNLASIMDQPNVKVRWLHSMCWQQPHRPAGQGCPNKGCEALRMICLGGCVLEPWTLCHTAAAGQPLCMQLYRRACEASLFLQRQQPFRKAGAHYFPCSSNTSMGAWVSCHGHTCLSSNTCCAVVGALLA